MGFIRHLLQHIRHGLLLYAVTLRLKKVGLEFRPYVLYRESLEAPAATANDRFVIQLITRENLDYVMTNFPEPYFVPRHWRERISAGDFGLVLSEGGELIGYTWANLRYCVFLKRLFDLKRHQAYLLDTYLVRSRRGQGLARVMRRAMLAELHRRGRHDLYSISESFNTPALKHKKRLRSQPLELRLFVGLFSRYNFDFRLRGYGQQQMAPRLVRSVG